MARARLVPELVCSDLAASLAFYTGALGFRILFTRPEDGFAYLERDGAELMLEAMSDESWLTGEMERPFGRGINFQIEVADATALRDAARAAGASVFRETEDAWYRQNGTYVGKRQFIAQDPDGYLLRFAQDLGTRTEPPAEPPAEPCPRVPE